MKSIIKKYVLPLLILGAFTTQISAQSRRSPNNNKRKNIKTVKKATPIKRVSNKNVVYKQPKKKVVAVRNVSNKKIIKHKGQNYYYANNKYYTQSRGRYIVIAPKIGFRIKVLPPNYKRVVHNNRNFFNFNGIFYVQHNDEYEVVEPEIGTVVYDLPADYEKVVIDGLNYYEYANVVYEKIQINGTRAYEVVGLIDIE